MMIASQRALRLLSGVRVVGGVLASRSLSRDIGQPTHYTHPELLKENEGKH